MLKKCFILILSTLLQTMAMASTQGIEGNTIKIGGFLPLSGPVSFIGNGFREGAETYIRYYNQELKYGGKNLDMTFLDGAYVAEKGLQAAKELVETKKVFAVVCSVGTPSIIASMDYLVQKGIPSVYQGSGATILSVPPKRNVFPVQPSFIYEGRIMIKLIADELKRKKVAIVYQNDEASQGLLEGISQILPRYIRKGVSIVEKIPVSLTENDFSSIVNRLKLVSPDAVIFFLYGGKAAGFVRSAKEAGIDFKKTSFVTTYVNYDTTIFKLAGTSFNQVYVGSFTQPNFLNKEFQRIWNKYSQSDKRNPGIYQLAGWLSVETFAQGLKRNFKLFGKNLTWETYIKSMETFNQNGGWSDGLAYKVSYSKFNPKDLKCRSPQSYMYFVLTENNRFKFYKKTNKLEDLYISNE